MTRQMLLDQLAQLVLSIGCSHPLRVAIDGIDAAGKTVLANELVTPLQASGRQIIRASIDGFHRPRAERYRRGPDSPEGYFFDSFDYPALRTALLEPLGPGGTRAFRTAVFDFRTDSAVDTPVQQAQEDAILVFEGVFLLRPELVDYWDWAVFVHADLAVAVRRAVERDRSLFGPGVDVAERYWNKYVPGQRLYFDTARPYEKADVIVDNNDFEQPRLVTVRDARVRKSC